ncbi:iron ABC transporter permease [Breoghania sp. JC706]|uniref:FecCD family ABC transporter permease n=1 Tax=Breoghania sp. JC706 TaxID=3117732 RepID=UPI00300A0C0C
MTSRELPGNPEEGAGNARALIAGYDTRIKRRLFILAALAFALLAAFVLDLVTGPSSMSMGHALKGLFGLADLSLPQRIIIFDVRVPAALTAILVGAALSLAGAEMQTVLNNPLASPFTLGVSSAASLGAALALVLGLGIPGVPPDWIVSGNAFVFAFASVLLLQGMARARGAGVETLVLVGIAMVFTFNALVALVQFVASQDALQQLVFWTMGSLGRASWDKLAILALLLIILLPLSLRDAWKLTALRLGEDRARSFGINVVRLRFVSLLRVSLLAGTSVAFVGTIGFIGLVGPHIARLLVGEDHRFFLPTAVLTGALLMSLASALSKVLATGVVLPVGIMTALIGVPFFVFLIFTSRERA